MVAFVFVPTPCISPYILAYIYIYINSHTCLYSPTYPLFVSSDGWSIIPALRMDRFRFQSSFRSKMERPTAHHYYHSYYHFYYYYHYCLLPRLLFLSCLDTIIISAWSLGIWTAHMCSRQSGRNPGALSFIFGSTVRVNGLLDRNVS